MKFNSNRRRFQCDSASWLNSKHMPNSMKSARILLSTFGSFGDIHPFLAIAKELQSRGHIPTIATCALYREKIEAENIRFHAMRPDLPPKEEWDEFIPQITNARSGTQFLFQKYLMPALRDGYQDLLPAAQETDFIVNHSIVFAGPLVAQKLNKPWLGTALAPLAFWSIQDPPLPPLLPMNARYYNWPKPYHQLVRKIARRVSLKWVQPVVQFRKELGLPRGAHPIFDDPFAARGVLALFSQELASPQSDWPANTVQTGACLYDQKGEGFGEAEYSGALSPAIKEFLQAGEAPLVFTLGSSAVFDAHNFYEESLQAAIQLKKRALFLIGEETNRPKKLPQNTTQFAAFEYAPYSEILPRASIIIHSGGAGTTDQTLRAGVPSLVMPFTNDQPDNAMRLQRRGIARAIAKRKYSASSAARELKMILDDSSYATRAKEIGARVRKENGAKTAVDAIEYELNRL